MTESGIPETPADLEVELPGDTSSIVPAPTSADTLADLALELLAALIAGRAEIWLVDGFHGQFVEIRRREPRPDDPNRWTPGGDGGIESASPEPSR